MAARSIGKYASFAELARRERPETDFRVLHHERAGAAVLVIAPHGGQIEVGTSEIATAIAGVEHSLFLFEGLHAGPRSRDLHITSHRFDHPRCLELAGGHECVLSVHGCRGRAQIFTGGLDEVLVACVARRLRDAQFDVVGEGHRYPGRHPFNICNRGARGAGVQLEITHDLRGPGHRGAIATAVRAALAEWTAAGSRIPARGRLPG